MTKMTKTRVPADLPGLLNRIGLTHIRVRRDEVWASCPSHKDSGDSWSINVKTGAHRCFACGYRGYLQMLVMDTLDCDNFQANRIIRSFGYEPPDPEELTKLIEEPATPVYQPEYEFIPELELRKFTDVPDWAIEDRNLTREAVDYFGLRWKKDREAWVIPIRSPGGSLLGWQEKDEGSGGRVRNRPRDMQKDRTVFGAEFLQVCDSLIIVESPLDVVYLYTIGYENAVATFGAVVSDNQLRLGVEYARSLVLALDNDDAGIENAARIISGYSYDQRGRRTKGTPWQARVPIHVANYQTKPNRKPKDVGDMDPDEVRHVIDTAVHAQDWLPKQKRQNESVQRPVKGLPSSRLRANARGQVARSGLRHGAREDRDHHRSGRGANRAR